MKYKSKLVEIEAHRWWKNGDHPEDLSDGEGKIVRYFRRPDVPGVKLCKHCSAPMHNHGWIDTLEGGHVVCPGDWVVKGTLGEYYPCKDEVFRKKYEPVE